MRLKAFIGLLLFCVLAFGIAEMTSAHQHQELWSDTLIVPPGASVSCAVVNVDDKAIRSGDITIFKHVKGHGFALAVSGRFVLINQLQMSSIGTTVGEDALMLCGLTLSNKVSVRAALQITFPNGSVILTPLR